MAAALAALISLTACNLVYGRPEPTPTPTPPVTTTTTPTVTPTLTLTPTATGTSAPPPVFSVSQPLPALACGVSPTGDVVNLRGGPGTNFAVAGVLPPGNWLQAAALDATSGWYQVRLAGTVVDGAWVAVSVVALQQPCACAPGGACLTATTTPPPPPGQCVLSVAAGSVSVPVFPQPTTGAGVVGQLNADGTFTQVAGRTNDGWFAIPFPGAVGVGLFAYRWVRADAPSLTVSGPCAGLPVFNYQFPAPPGNCAAGALPGETVPIFNQPSESFGIWGSLTAGSTVQIIGPAAGGWFGVDPGVAQGGNVGIWRLRWVRTDAPLTFIGNCDNLPVISYTG
jgi:hypothetical protein